MDAFFESDGDGFVATALTRGPWNDKAQHAGPPAALLARAVEVALPDDFRLARLTLDILRPVPIGRVTPLVTVDQGRRVARAALALDADGVEVITGTAVAQRILDGDIPSVPAGSPMPPPESGTAEAFFDVGWDEGYHTAMEWRFVQGSWSALGPAQAWFRQRVPLVAGEDPSPAQRTLAVADTGNGISAAVDFYRYGFVNTDLSVNLHRDPTGEWIGMDATTTTHPTGAGLATTILHDVTGPIGTGNQSLLVTPHP